VNLELVAFDIELEGTDEAYLALGEDAPHGIIIYDCGKIKFETIIYKI
jgi:hypothetical protein